MATVQPRKNKEGEIVSYKIRVFKGRDANGKLLFENTSFPVDPNWKESTARKKAEAFASTFERDLKNGVLSNENRTFEAYAEYVIALKESSNKCKISTLDTYRMHLRRLSPCIGYIKLKDLRPDHLNRLYMDLASGSITGNPLKPKTIQGIHGFISSVLEQAFKEGIVVSNVAQRAEPPRITPAPPKALEIDDLQHLFDILKDEPIHWRTAILLLINTGLRRGELCGLKWDKVDLNNGTIEISNNLLHRRKGNQVYEDTPKTKMSNRILRIPSDMVDCLKQYKTWQLEQRLRLGEYYQDRGWVFSQDNGDPILPNSLTNYCGKLSKKSGLHVWSHLLRHTQASILIANNVPISSVSQRLGHSQASTTMNIYAHALKNADEENVKVLENVLYKHIKA